MSVADWQMFYTFGLSVFIGLMFAYGYAAGSQWQ